MFSTKIAGQQHNFDKIPEREWLNLGTPFDYKSIMIYQSTAFSKNDGKVES